MVGKKKTPRERRRARDLLSPREAMTRKYPKVGSVDTINDVKELIHAVEHDPKIDRKMKQKRLHFMFSLTHARSFEMGFHGNIGEARSLFQHAYRKYVAK
jgi:hypothetical protein